MTFTSGQLIELANVGAGEPFGKNHLILSNTSFEDGLVMGRFAKLDTAQIDNMDGSVSPVIAGVVKRIVSNSEEAGGTINAALTTKIEYVRQGLVSVDVKAAETPALFGRVYVSNAGDDNDGLATATNTDEAVNAEFIMELKTNVWLVYVNPAPGDIATHIADALGAHAATAISVLDAAGLTAAVNVETALAELLQLATVAIADPGDAGAIPVTRSGTVAITTTGVVDTRTIAIPTFATQRITVSLDVDAGDAVITAASAINQAGNTIMTMADAGDIIELIAVQVAGALVWRVGANDGVALS